MLIIMKFGGTSVGSVDALKNVVKIVADAKKNGHDVVVVVSAMSGVTNLLLNAAHQAEAGNEEAASQARVEIDNKHAEATRHFLGDSPQRDEVMVHVRMLLDEFEALCHGIHVLGELTPRALDVIGGIGERLNAPQVAAILDHAGLSAESVEATELIVTDNCFGGAVPRREATQIKSQARLGPLLEGGKIAVVTGFIGATEEGITTTLGRGGSDYSATIIGRALEADEVWIWTDVNGVMTADPRVVPDAHPISHLSYAEISELSYFGAKVLHSQAIRPARRVNLPVRILNTFEPDHPGTLITADYKNNGKTVKAVTAIKNLSLITVSGPGMIGITGVAGRTFSAVAKTNTNVLMISQASSEQSICFVVPTPDIQKVVNSLENELSREIERRDLERVKWEENTVILAVVGAGMKGHPGVSGRLFSSLGEEKINIIAIAQGSSEFNISLVVAQGDADRAVKAIHKQFALEKP